MGFLSEIPPAIWVVITGAAPIFELRGAIPLAWQLGFDPGPAFLLAVLGNLLPIIPLLLFLRVVREFLEENVPVFETFFNWLDRRTYRRSERVEKYGIIGLIILTAIPLPTTGAWTASLAAVLFKLPFWPSFFAILTGVFLAGILVMLITFGFISNFFLVG